MNAEQAIERIEALGYETGTPFFLHVGGASWYKNRLGVVQIFDRLQQLPAPAASRLLLVGSAFEPEVSEYLRAHDLEANVTRLEGLSNEDLRAVYSLAEALIFPSLQEGFGWPIVEAQACGCPVFTTGREPMTEVGGGAAVYFDPADPAAAARLIAGAIPGRAAICSAGLENVRRFSVEQMIDGFLKAYGQVAGSDR
jgi:glycosyltransferase involved in cell wall biosynthesis